MIDELKIKTKNEIESKLKIAKYRLQMSKNAIERYTKMIDQLQIAKQSIVSIDNFDELFALLSNVMKNQLIDDKTNELN